MQRRGIETQYSSIQCHYISPHFPPQPQILILFSRIESRKEHRTLDQFNWPVAIREKPLRCGFLNFSSFSFYSSPTHPLTLLTSLSLVVDHSIPNGGVVVQLLRHMPDNNWQLISIRQFITTRRSGNSSWSQQGEHNLREQRRWEHGCETMDWDGDDNLVISFWTLGVLRQDKFVVSMNTSSVKQRRAHPIWMRPLDLICSLSGSVSEHCAYF